MENQYRKSLRSASDEKSEENIFFPSDWLYRPLEASPIALKVESIKPLPSVSSESASVLSEEVEKPSAVTEKIEVLDSLNIFGKEKLAESDLYPFKGGELRRKELEPDSLSLKVPRVDKEQFLEIQNLKGLFNQFSNDQLAIKAMFVTDESFDSEGEIDSKFLKYFTTEVSQLFTNMVKAMNLSMDEVYISSLEFEGKSFEENLLKELSFLKPKFVFCLGAKATNYFFKSQQRLKDCHGQIKEINLSIQGEESLNIKFMPLFSPKLLHTAPNMKRLAWNDMQKAMDHLKD